MTAKDYLVIQTALDDLGKALADHNHKWTRKERDGYDQAQRILKRHLEPKPYPTTPE